MARRVPTIHFSLAEPEELVEFWFPLYEDKREDLYSGNIGRALTPGSGS